MTFAAPTQCDKLGADASIYIDMTFGGRLTKVAIEATGSGVSGEFQFSDIHKAAGILEILNTAITTGGTPAVPFLPKLCLLETAQGDLTANNTGNSVEKQIRSFLQREAGPIYTQFKLPYRGNIRTKRSVEISFDMAIDPLYVGNEIIRLAGAAGWPLSLLITSGFIHNGTQQGIYGDFLLEGDSENYPYEGDTNENITIRPLACTHNIVRRVQTVFDGTNVTIFDLDNDYFQVTQATTAFSVPTAPEIFEARKKALAERLDALNKEQVTLEEKSAEYAKVLQEEADKAKARKTPPPTK